MTWVGSSTPSLEATRLLDGCGGFLGNRQWPGGLHVAFRRSEYPHARILDIDVSAALALPGVRGVILGSDMRAHSNRILDSKVLRMGKGVIEFGVTKYRLPDFYALSEDEVNYVGEPIALVVADSRALAEDAAELLDVRLEPLEPVVMMGDALRDRESHRTFAGWNSNVGFEFHRSYGAVQKVFASAPHIIRGCYSMHRSGYPPLEPMIVAATWQEPEGLTVHLTTQRVHVARTALADVLRLPEALIRVIAPQDIGGGFGSKAPFYRETFAVAFAAIRFGAPVVWKQDRAEALLSGGHERDGIAEIEGAFDNGGRLLAQRIRLWQDVGCAKVDQYSYASPLASALMSSPYSMQAYEIEVKGVLTNKPPGVVNRTAGKMPLVFAVERFMDRAALELGRRRTELRRINLPDTQPYETPAGARLEGDFRGAYDALLAHMRYDEVARWAAAQRAEGRALGIGTSVTCDIASPRRSALGSRGYGQPFYASARLRIEVDGELVVYTGDSPQGQGRATSFAQVVADQFDVRPADVRSVLGDTALSPFTNHGAHTQTAVHLAALDLRAKVLAIGAHVLGTSEDDCDLVAGNVTSASGGSVPLREIARIAYLDPDRLPPDTGPFLEVTRTHESPRSTNGFSAHACLVDVTPGTGEVRIRGWWSVGDSGRIMNPMALDGALHGSIAAGISNSLFEHYEYGRDGQPGFADVGSFLMARATDLPDIDLIHHNTETDLSLLGFKKGITEGGAAGAPPALVAAIEDALRPLRSEFADLPITPERVWRHIQRASSAP